MVCGNSRQIENIQKREDVMYKNYRPAHSDFLIHWTGRDIDKKDPDWINESSSITSKKVTQLYLSRLKYILKFSLWMTKDKKSEFLSIGPDTIKRPYPARTCFTELKLSEVRSHAAEYGRLGIGFKRFFLFDRLGGPMIYYQNKRRGNWFFPPYFGESAEYRPYDYFACFLKPMVKERKDPSNITMVYSFYDESEWRIIYSQQIEGRLSKLNRSDVISKFRKPNDIEDKDFKEYIQKNDIKPEYLIPVKDRWLSMIIFPSLAVKVEAERNEEIRNLLEEIKPRKSSNTFYDKPAPWERHSKLIELDIDACRNF